MTRNRKSAKAAGARFEKAVATFLGGERRAKEGRHDRGDIAGVTAGSYRVVIECKDCTRLALPEWWREAEREAENDGAAITAIVHKRHGDANPAHQWVTMDLDMFRTILQHIAWLEDHADIVIQP